MSSDQYVVAKQAGLSSHEFPDKLQPVYLVLENHYKTSQESLSIPDLANLFFASVSQDKQFYEELFSNLSSLQVSDQTSLALVHSLVRSRKLKELSLAAYEAYEGRMQGDKFNELVEAFKALPGANVSDEEDDIYVSDDIEQVVKEAFQTPGLRWRLNTMNKMLGSLRDGDFGFIFARPETGKTTFLASELTFMAEQLVRPCVWLANEEDGRKVMMRLYQAAFGIDLPTLMSDLPGWHKKYKSLYGDKLRLISRLDLMTRNGVEKLIERIDPELVVIDQLSKITGFESDRKDLELGAACEWGRRIAKGGRKVVAVHQADGTAEGVKWLNMNHVSNAKTAMQAEADWILGIGKQNADGYEGIRYLHLSKNKLTGDEDTDPKMRHGKMETLIHPELGRYADLF